MSNVYEVVSNGGYSKSDGCNIYHHFDEGAKVFIVSVEGTASFYKEVSSTRHQFVADCDLKEVGDEC